MMSSGGWLRRKRARRLATGDKVLASGEADQIGSSSRTAQRSKSLISRFKIEALVVVLLIATLASVRYHDILLRKTFVITPASSSAYGIRAYGDELQPGGNSTIKTDPKQPLSWSCELRDGYQNFYCGYELLIDRDRRGKGIDLSQYVSVSIELSYEGSAEWVRFYVKNFDPRYSDLRVEESVKFNMIEFLNGPDPQQVDINLSDFSVADWWLVNNKIPAELSRPQFENIVAIDVQPGTGAKVGMHRFKIESITFQGALLSQAQWYLCLLGFWALLVCLILAHHVLSQKKQLELKHRLQLLESRQLQLAKTAAENASRAKSDFLSNMSHELRTPLNAILGYAQLLGRENLSERQATAARTIEQSGNHLLTLITDILDLSKIEAGKFELHETPIDLHSCLQRITDMIRVRAHERDLVFNWTIPVQLPRYVVGDEKRLNQVLINLLGNAVKFTTRGSVTLAISIISIDGMGACLRFEVRDTGCGIAPDRLALIFQPFEQVGDAEHKAGGTGLGLSISRQLVALMGSSIAVESKEGEGSRFWFDLSMPLAEPATGLMSPHAKPVTGYSGARRRILIVDDIGANRSVLADALDALGFETIEAGDGAEALEMAQTNMPDLVLMDLRMPVMDGFEATRRMRLIDALARVPIIAVSASVTEEVQAASLAAGADAFLTKPVDHEELAQLLVRHLVLDWKVAEPSTPHARKDGSACLVPPPQEQIRILLQLAQAGNMRAIKAQADQIDALDPQYRPFAEQLRRLAAAYQSPAILELIGQHCDTPQAA